MARPRMPESQLSPESFEKNKALYARRLNEPKPVGELGPPSRWLTKGQKKIWKRLVKNSPAVLGESDRSLLEITCTLQAKLEAGNIDRSDTSLLLQCLRQLGQIPPTRQAIKKEALTPDEWDALDAE